MNNTNEENNLIDVRHPKATRKTGGSKEDTDKDNRPQVKVADEETSERSCEVGAGGAKGKGPTGHLTTHLKLPAEVEEEDAKRANEAESEAIYGSYREGNDPRPTGVWCTVTDYVVHFLVVKEFAKF